MEISLIVPVIWVREFQETSDHAAVELVCGIEGSELTHKCVLSACSCLHLPVVGEALNWQLKLLDSLPIVCEIQER